MGTQDFVLFLWFLVRLRLFQNKKFLKRDRTLMNGDQGMGLTKKELEEIWGRG